MGKRLSKTVKKNLVEKLISNIQESPTNLSAAFRVTAKQSNSTAGAISQLWYKEIRSQKAVFMVKTQKGVTINYKQGATLKETKQVVVLARALIDISDFDDKAKIDFFDLILG